MENAREQNVLTSTTSPLPPTKEKGKEKAKRATKKAKAKARAKAKVKANGKTADDRIAEMDHRVETARRQDNRSVAPLPQATKTDRSAGHT